MRGDEPLVQPTDGPAVTEFPACAGMNPQLDLLDRVGQRVPRMRGDEPATCCHCCNSIASSPHARG